MKHFRIKFNMNKIELTMTGITKKDVNSYCVLYKQIFD